MKKILFTVILTLTTYLVVELFAFVAYRIKFGEYQLSSINQAKLDVITAATQRGVFEPAAALSNRKEVKPILHPYLGFTVDGKIRSPDCMPTEPYDCYSRIKVASDGQLAKRGPNKLVVAILGGSFADGTARGGSPGYYAHLFSGIPQFSDKNIIVYNLAAGGYKQPQQLMHLAYYYALGAEFDFVINIDGFNELAASYYGWRDDHLHPAFPTSWDKRVSSGVDQQYIERYSNKRILAEKHTSTAQFFRIKAIRHSPFMNFVWELLNVRYAQQKSVLEQPSPKTKQLPRDFQYEALGPDYDIPNLSSFNDYAVNLWANSSKALRAMVEGQGGAYYHFLQPNQYIDGAKLLSVFERKNTVLKQGGYGHVYKNNYPKLAKKGKQLTAQGINFHNLTYLFKDNAEDLYIDNCCHLNSKGYDLVVWAIVAKIAKQLKQQKTAETNAPN